MCLAPLTLQSTKTFQWFQHILGKKLLGGVYWKLAILKNLIRNHIDGWSTLLWNHYDHSLFQLEFNYLWILSYDSFDVSARVTSPAVQEIVVTKDMVLVLGCTIFFACSESCASLKCNLFRYHFQIRKYNWWWNLAFETISYTIS